MNFRATLTAKLVPHMVVRAAFLMVVAALAPATALARPTITNVNQSTTYTTIQQAVNAANPNDVIEIGAGVQVERGITFTNRILTIRGQGPGQTIIDGNHVEGRIVRVNDVSNVTFDGLTFRNGLVSAGNGGSALLTDGASSFVVVRNCMFEGHRAPGRPIGAIEIDRINTITFEQCIFRNNATGASVSTYVQLSGAASFRECVFADAGTESFVTYLQNNGIGVPSIDLVNCSFGGGQHNTYLLLENGTANVTNSVFGPGTNPIVPVGPLSSFNASRSVYPGATGNNINGAPTFIDAAAGDLRLAPNSLGIDVGNLDALLAKGGGLFDVGNDGRLVNDPRTPNTGTGIRTHLDAGAYEFQADTARCSADFNGNGVISSQDFFDFIAAFFSGCP